MGSSGSPPSGGLSPQKASKLRERSRANTAGRPESRRIGADLSQVLPSRLLAGSALSKESGLGATRSHRTRAHTCSLCFECGCGLWAWSTAGRRQKAHERRPLFDQQDVRLYIASALANSGNLAPAAAVCADLEAARPRVRPASSQTFAKLVRLQGTISPNLKQGRNAVAIARDSADPTYHRRTSNLILASAFEASCNFNRAQQVVDELGPEMHECPGSMWHAIQYDMLAARSHLLSRNTGAIGPKGFDAVRALIRAQYASALLDFVGIPIPDFRLAKDNSAIVRLTPTQHIHWFCSALGLSKTKMLELRKGAVFQGQTRAPHETWALGFQRTVLDIVRGRSNITPETQ